MSETKTNAQAHSEGKQIADTVCWADISVTDLGRAILLDCEGNRIAFRDL